MASSPRQEEQRPALGQEFIDQLERCSASAKQYLYHKVADGYAREEIFSEARATSLERYVGGEKVENFRGWFLKILQFKVLRYFRDERMKGFAGIREAFNEELHTGTGTGMQS